jgi:ABC-type dipeptide/oligopeptide/nickel transport system permease subunit
MSEVLMMLPSVLLAMMIALVLGLGLENDYGELAIAGKKA